MQFFIMAAPIYITTNSVGGSLFSTPSPAFIACRLLDRNHSDWCEILLFTFKLYIKMISYNRFSLKVYYYLLI